MISDVLWEAVTGLDRYLTDALYNDCYSPELRGTLTALRNEMDAIRAELDRPPTLDRRAA